MGARGFGSLRHRKICGRLPEDLVGLAKLAVLALRCLQLLSDLRGRLQTKKHRAIIRCPEKLQPWLDVTNGQFVRNDREAVTSIRSAWDSMRTELKLPAGVGGGSKCIRRSMATLLRARGCPPPVLELQLGHRVLRSTTELYAPDSPDYLAESLKIIEAIMDEIEALVPSAFTGTAPDAQTSNPSEGAEI